jgi:hypothetical protein
MPYKDPQKKLERMKEWRAKNDTPEYMKWLYARRKLHENTAAIHEQTLLLIARTMHTSDAAKKRAEQSLAEAEKMRREVGNRYDHQNNKPYYEEGKE